MIYFKQLNKEGRIISLGIIQNEKDKSFDNRFETIIITKPEYLKLYRQEFPKLYDKKIKE